MVSNKIFLKNYDFQIIYPNFGTFNSKGILWKCSCEKHKGMILEKKKSSLIIRRVESSKPEKELEISLIGKNLKKVTEIIERAKFQGKELLEKPSQEIYDLLTLEENEYYDKYYPG